MKISIPCLVLSLLSVAAAAEASVTELTDCAVYSSLRLEEPGAIAVDAAGNLYVAGGASDNVLKIPPGRHFVEIIDESGDGIQALEGAKSLAVDASGNVFVAGSASHNVFKITPDGEVLEILDGDGDGTRILRGPRSLVVDGSGNVFVAGFSTDNVFRITSAGVVTEIIGRVGDGVHQLIRPIALAVDDSGNVYVASRDGYVLKVAPTGSVTQIIDSEGDGVSPLEVPSGLAVDDSGNVYVSGLESENVFRIAPSGEINEIIDRTGDGSGGNPLWGASDVIVDDVGTIFVAGFASDNVFEINSAGEIHEIVNRSTDGTNQLLRPSALAAGGHGVVYVTGFASDNVFEIRPAGLADAAGLILPGFEVEIEDPTGPTTLFAIRNTSDESTYGQIDYVGVGAEAMEPFHTAEFTLGPGETLTRDVRDDLSELEAAGGSMNGILVVTEQDGTTAPRLEGDYFRLDRGNDFASGDRMVRPAELCNQQEIRFLDFGAGSRLQILLDHPRGEQTASFSYTAYDEAGIMVAEGDVFTQDFVTTLEVDELVQDTSFGSIRFDFAESLGGLVTARHSAFGRFSAELDGACLDEEPTDPAKNMEIIDQEPLCGRDFFLPTGLDLDTSGNVYVASMQSSRVFKITPGGTKTEIINEGGNPDDYFDSFKDPIGLAVDGSGNVFVAGNISDNVFRITPDGSITEILDETGDGVHELEEPEGVTVDAAGSVYVAGGESNNVLRVDPDGSVTEILDASGDGEHPLDRPREIAVDTMGNVYVTGFSSDNVFRIQLDGTVTEILDSTGDGTHNLEGPFGVAVDMSGNVYVTGAISHNVFKIASDGSITEILDSMGDGTRSFCCPRPVAVDASGNVYVGEHNALGDVFQIAPDGSIAVLRSGPIDDSVRMTGAYAMALDAAGAIYVSGFTSQNAIKIPSPDPKLADASGLIVPGYEVAVEDPAGSTTFFAVRNTTDDSVTGEIRYLDSGSGEPARTDSFALGPQETLARNVRDDLSGLSIEDGIARGLIVVAESGDNTASSLQGDYFRLNPGNDFATGERLVRSADFCLRQEVRFVDFGGGSKIQVLVDRPRDSSVPSFSYTAYDEGGAIVGSGELFTSSYLSVLDASELASGERFGSLRFDFANAGGGWAAVEHSAFGRFSVELEGACLD